MHPTYLTPGELARRLGVGLTAIAVASRAGELPPAAHLVLRGGRTQPLFDRASVAHYVDAAHRRYDRRERYRGFLDRLDRGLERIDDGE